MHLKKLSFLTILLLSLGLAGCGSDNLDAVTSGSGDSSSGTDTTDTDSGDNGDSGGDTDNGSNEDSVYTASGNFTPKIIQRGQTFTFNYYLDKTPDAAIIYDIDIVGTAIQGTNQDYTISNASTLTFAKGSTTTSLTITTYQKDDIYDARTLSLTLTGNTGEPATINLLISGNVYLNDTGITTYSDGSSFDIQTQANDKYKQQDAAYGLDIIINSAATEPDTGDKKDDQKQLYKNAFDVNPSDSEYKGKAGFRFVKITNNGTPVVADSTSYECVTDEVTGLTWQVKGPQNIITHESKSAPDDPDVYTMADVQNYKASNFQYPWQASKLGTEGLGWYLGLNKAALDEGAEEGAHYANQACGYPNEGRNGSDVEGLTLTCSTGSYADEVNRLGVCGKTNWVIPSVEQLRSILNYNDVVDYSAITGIQNHALDNAFFDCKSTNNCVIEKNYITECFFVIDENDDVVLDINGNPTSHCVPLISDNPDPVYWTSNQVKSSEQLAWCVNLQTGSVNKCHKREYHRVLVVSSNVPTEFFTSITTTNDSAE
ncbi:hypothetical protein AKG98_555 [Moritella sp. JT01]|uniref:Lcl domain-containing protein n=1 Tax=Moritella sp. JT01 TaxID=756698 RepID=UPI00079B8220|nr:DUF1566 domain-containing protein [Moritella sp. JT01]KXO11172.1 hypothetical protein AKG98_555 [Moritella sp. JT01]